MAVEVRLPRFSEEMTEATISRWLKNIGDSVDKGEPIVEVETEKVIVEVEAPRAGVIVSIAAEEQEVVPVDGLLCMVGMAGEVSEAPPRRAAPATAQEDAGQGEDTGDTSGSNVVPMTHRPASQPAQTHPSSPATQHSASQHTNAQAVAAAPASLQAASPVLAGGAVPVSPLARRVAEELGIDLTRITGTGIGGKIVMADLQPYLGAQASQALPRAPQPRAAQPPVAQVSGDSASRDSTSAISAPDTLGVAVPHSSLRRTIARRLSQSKREIPHFYMSAEIDMTEALALRSRLNEAEEGVRVSVNDLMMKAVASALERVPALNATYNEDTVIRHEAVHLGFAAAIDEGLVTPVVRDCHLKSIGRIARESEWLIEQARTRRLATEHMEGGTFTISNLGMYPVVEFSAIINPPQVGILAVAQPQEQPVSLNGRLAFRKRMRVTLSADHRAVDGVTGAEFLAALKALLENPERLML